MNWKQYQVATAEIFRSIGWEAEVEANVVGVRGVHAVDVHVTFTQHGLDCSWVVECKHWGTAVPKEKVAALKAIVDDIGADKGVLVSKEGFQSGAISFANKSNIILTSLDELVEGVSAEIRMQRISRIETHLIRTSKIYNALADPSLNNRFGFMDSGISGIEGQKTIALSMLVREASKYFTELKLGNNNFKIYDVQDYNKLDMNCYIPTHETNNIDEFLYSVESVVKQAQIWIDKKNVTLQNT